MAGWQGSDDKYWDYDSRAEQVETDRQLAEALAHKPATPQEVKKTTDYAYAALKMALPASHKGASRMTTHGVIGKALLRYQPQKA